MPNEQVPTFPMFPTEAELKILERILTFIHLDNNLFFKLVEGDGKTFQNLRYKLADQLRAIAKEQKEERDYLIGDLVHRASIDVFGVSHTKLDVKGVRFYEKVIQLAKEEKL